MPAHVYPHIESPAHLAKAFEAAGFSPPSLGHRGAPRRKRTFTVADVAKDRGTDWSAAFRYLSRNAKSHLRKVRGVWTVPADVYLSLNTARAMADLMSRVAKLEDDNAELLRRVNALASRAR
jgi:hypothetical protein